MNKFGVEPIPQLVEIQKYRLRSDLLLQAGWAKGPSGWYHPYNNYPTMSMADALAVEMDDRLGI